MHFSKTDIAVEIFQKSAPSPIRKLHKKYAAHVARFVLCSIYRQILYSLSWVKCGCVSPISKTNVLFTLGKRASLHVP